MAKRSKSKSKRKTGAAKSEEVEAIKPAPKISLADIDAMSSSDDDNDDDGGQDSSPDAAYEHNPKAKKLREAIAAGQFDHLIEQFDKKLTESSGAGENDDSGDEFEEVVLADDSSDENEQQEEEMEQAGDESDDDEEENNSEEDEDKGDGEDGDKNDKQLVQLDDEDAAKSKAVIQSIFGEAKDSQTPDLEDGESDDEDKDDADPSHSVVHKNVLSAKALALVVGEIQSTKSKLPWAETLEIVSSEPLPFGEHNDGNPLDIHDDLKREVAFYNMALDAVHAAKPKCAEANIAFSRPDDFFAEMVKTDDHMAKVKDRLIFETKKIEAVAQRKANKEHKLRAKESRSNKAVEKAKRKKDHFQQVADWAETAASQRGGALGDDVDKAYLERMNGSPGKKRQAADRKYGFGGKKGRFKQNDRKSIDDTSSYNWRGNFPGIGTKKGASGSGANRKGKRARDASRTRR